MNLQALEDLKNWCRPVSQWQIWDENLCPLNISQMLFALNTHFWSRKIKCSGKRSNLLLFFFFFLNVRCSNLKKINKFYFIWTMLEWKSSFTTAVLRKTKILEIFFPVPQCLIIHEDIGFMFCIYNRIYMWMLSCLIVETKANHCVQTFCVVAKPPSYWPKYFVSRATYYVTRRK